MGKGKALSAFESMMLVCGSGLGTGILAIPYIAVRMGFLQALFCIGLACGVSMVLHLLVADLALHSKNSSQLLGIFEQHLFLGKRKKVLSGLFFVVLSAMLLMNMTLYITCAAEVAQSVFGVSLVLAKCIFYGVASLLVIMGIKAVGISEKYSMLLIGVVVAALGALSLSKARMPFPLIKSTSPAAMVALYSMGMFSFSAVFSVPQVVNHIGDKSKIRRSVMAGIGLNALITMVFLVITVMASQQVTPVATVGLSLQHGFGVAVLSAVFVILAMLTSFLSIALAQIEVVREKTQAHPVVAWLCSTLPTVLLAVFLPLGIASYVEIVGGIFAIIVVLMVLPSYRHAVKGALGPLLLGKTGRSGWLVALLALMYLVMSAGALIPLD